MAKNFSATEGQPNSARESPAIKRFLWPAKSVLTLKQIKKPQRWSYRKPAGILPLLGPEQRWCELGSPAPCLPEARCHLCAPAPGEKGQRIISLDYRAGLDVGGRVDQDLVILIAVGFCAELPHWQRQRDTSAKSPEGSQPLGSGYGDLFIL